MKSRENYKSGYTVVTLRPALGGVAKQIEGYASLASPLPKKEVSHEVDKFLNFI